uniref:Uncharacterized protein n=1 Tax=viral metagenome TaxID=1070528 RepID=A0A6C0JIQ4_9ZZZZ
MTSSYFLPLNVLQLISEYSKPFTRPNWRKSKPIISGYDLMMCVSNPKSKLHYRILNNITKTDWYIEWYKIQDYIKYYGIDNYCQYHNKKYDDIIRIKGIQFAQNFYEI